MSDTQSAIRIPVNEDKPKLFVFVLLENFTMLSFASAVECLRIANRMAGRDLYDWRLIGEGGTYVSCSAGAQFTLDGDLDELRREDTLVICSGIDVQAATTKKLLGWLRREARKGMMVGGLCTAAFTLAKAGLLDGKKATIHWENQDSFTEEFEDVTLTKSVFVVDGNRMTTAGGTSSIDLMLKLIADDQGEEMANSVADQPRSSASLARVARVVRVSIPATIGAAKEVPRTVVHPPACPAAAMSAPGAEKST